MKLSTKAGYISFAMLFILMLSMWLPTPTVIFIVMLLTSVLMVILVLSVLKEPSVSYPELKENEEGGYLKQS